MERKRNYKETKTSSPTEKVKVLDYDIDFEQIAYDAFTVYIDNFYTHDEEEDVWRFGGFWTGAETFEIVIDAYEHTGDARYKEMIDQIYEGFTKDYKHQEVEGWWGGNDYNDDLMWITIACARSYLATEDTKYLATAKVNFDNTYARAWSDELGGGLFWRADNKTKNACVNGPGAIAACFLGEALDDESYFEKAKNILEWEREVLFDPVTGHIDDNVGLNGGRNSWASTYNQGTFIGASCLLYDHYGKEKYLSDAVLAADYTMIDMYHYGVMNNEESGEDLPGFKGIFTRWLNDLIVNHNQPQYIDWMQYNARTAWNNRNSAGITKTQWGKKTEDSESPSSWDASAATALYQNTPNSKDLIRSAFHPIPAKDFDSVRNITIKTENGMKYVGDIKNGAYTVYHNVDFGNIAPEAVEFQVFLEVAGGSIELHVKSQKGEPAAVLDVTKAQNANKAINNWTNQATKMTTKVTGLQTVYLVYKTEESQSYKLNFFRFLAEN